MRTNRITTLTSVFVVPLLIALSLPAMAAETGKLQGTVYDPDGVPLAGVTVTISSENMMGKRKTQTAEDGSFLFFGLPPGKYQVEIDQSGFLPFKQEEVRVQIGGTASLDILLEVPTAEETITVTAKRPVVDKEKTSLGTNFDDEFLEEVPVSRQYQSVAQLAPGVTGGGNPNVHGSSLYSNQYLVDGVNTTDPVTNTFAFNMNYDAIKEFQILTGGLDAEYGQAMGGVINLVTKSGGNEFHVDTTFYMRPDWLTLKDDFEKDDAGRQDMYQFNVNVGGPIIKDKLWYFASVELDRNITSISPTEDFFDPTNPDPIQHPSRKWFSVYYLGKLTYQMTDKHKITAMTMGDPTWLENEIQAVKTAPEAERQRYQGGAFYSLAWEALWSKSLFQKTQVAFKDQRLFIYPMGCHDLDNPDCRGHYDAATGLSTINDTYYTDDKRYRLQADTSVTYYLDNFIGDHEWKSGIQFAHTWNTNFDKIPGGASYTDYDGQPYRITRMVPGEDGEISGLETTLSGDTLSWYLQDAWKITDTLTFKPGVRIDWAQTRNYADEVITEFLTTSPRINMVWDATGDGKTVVRAGYNRYVDTGYLWIASFVGKSMETETYEYNPDTGKYDIFYSSAGGEDGVTKKDNMTAPHCDEISLQVERELFTDFSLAINGIWRETKYFFEDDEANMIWNQQGTDVIGFKNGEETYIWSVGTPRQGFLRYWGAELVARKAFSNNWQMNASYTYSRSEGTMERPFTSFLDNPRQTKYWFGWMPFDKRHTIKLDGGYHLPYGIEVGASFYWATGEPYSKYVTNNFWGGYNNLAWNKGYDPDHPDNPYWNRTPNILRLDLKLVWDLKELTGQQIDLIVEMINVMHLRDKTLLETADYPPGSPTEYGNYYGLTTGFRGALGIRYRY